MEICRRVKGALRRYKEYCEDLMNVENERARGGRMEDS